MHCNATQCFTQNEKGTSEQGFLAGNSVYPLLPPVLVVFPRPSLPHLLSSLLFLFSLSSRRRIELPHFVVIIVIIVLARTPVSLSIVSAFSSPTFFLAFSIALGFGWSFVVFSQLGSPPCWGNVYDYASGIFFLILIALSCSCSFFFSQFTRLVLVLSTCVEI